MGEFTIDGILLPTGLHSARPAAGSVAKGTLYPESDTGKIYQSDGASTWTLWATLGGAAGTPGLTLGTSNSAGSATTFVATDATILVFDATNPSTQSFGDSPVVGTATTAAHRDHKHGMPAAPAGGLIGINVYHPSTRQLYSTTSATFADVDATNMAVTFTAPASGNVLVRLSAWCDLATASWFYWALRESTTNLGTPTVVARGSSQGFATIAFYLTGLSAGSHTYKWAFATDGTSGQAGRIWAGNGNSSGQESGPATMEVWAA